MPGNEVESRAESGRTLTLPYLPTTLARSTHLSSTTTRTTTTTTRTKSSLARFREEIEINYYIYENTREDGREGG